MWGLVNQQSLDCFFLLRGQCALITVTATTLAFRNGVKILLFVALPNCAAVGRTNSNNFCGFLVGAPRLTQPHNLESLCFPDILAECSCIDFFMYKQYHKTKLTHMFICHGNSVINNPQGEMKCDKGVLNNKFIDSCDEETSVAFLK